MLKVEGSNLGFSVYNCNLFIVILSGKVWLRTTLRGRNFDHVESCNLIFGQEISLSLIASANGCLTFYWVKDERYYCRAPSLWSMEIIQEGRHHWLSQWNKMSRASEEGGLGPKTLNCMWGLAGSAYKTERDHRNIKKLTALLGYNAYTYMYNKTPVLNVCMIPNILKMHLCANI